MLKLAIFFTLSVIYPAYVIEHNVRVNCTGDYLAHCSHTVPGTEACRKCFKSVGAALSKNCKTAIKNSTQFNADYNEEAKRYTNNR